MKNKSMFRHKMTNRGVFLSLLAKGFVAMFAFIFLGIDVGLVVTQRDTLQKVLDNASQAGMKRLDYTYKAMTLWGQEPNWRKNYTLLIKNDIIKEAAKSNVSILPSEIILEPEECPKKITIRKCGKANLFFCVLFNIDSANFVIDSTSSRKSVQTM